MEIPDIADAEASLADEGMRRKSTPLNERVIAFAFALGIAAPDDAAAATEEF